MPYDVREYHPDWAWIREQILEQAEHRCEWCGIAHDTYAVWVESRWMPVAEWQAAGGWEVFGTPYVVHIWLTIAHLDHDHTNDEPGNLRALCQRCHLNHDRPMHLVRRIENLRAKRLAAGQRVLL